MNRHSRLRRLEKIKAALSDRLYIFFIGDREHCQFRTLEECDEELKRPKYRNAKVIKIIEPTWDDVKEYEKAKG